MHHPSTNPFLPDGSNQKAPFFPHHMNPQQMFADSRSSSTVSMPTAGTPGPIPSMMNMFDFNNSFQFINTVPNNRASQVNQWLNNFGTSPVGVHSVLSQISLGAPSQISLLSQNTRISVVNNEQQDEKTVKAAFDCVIMSLESFDITESDVNEKVFHILNRVKIINTKEDARELIAAIWNALSRVNHIQLIEVPEKAKERMTMFHNLINMFFTLSRQYRIIHENMEERDRQSVLRSIVVFLPERCDESVLQLLNNLLTKSTECQRILSIRNDPSDPYMDSMKTLKRLCDELNHFSLQHRPNALLAIFRSIFVILGYCKTKDDMCHQKRFELYEHFFRGGFELTLKFFHGCVTEMCSSKSNIEIYEPMIRCISRLISKISETGVYMDEQVANAMADNVIETNVIERSAAWLSQFNYINKTGYEVRCNFVKTYARLSSRKGKLRYRDLNQAVLFIVNCIQNLSKYSPQDIKGVGASEVASIAQLGTGFISNVSAYNTGVQRMLTEDINCLRFIIQVACESIAVLNEKQLDESKIGYVIGTIENCIAALCHLGDPSNPLSSAALQFMCNIPEMIFFTQVVLLNYSGHFRLLSSRLKVVLLTMWKRAFYQGFIPPSPQDLEQQGDITPILLGFFTDNVQKIGSGRFQQQKKEDDILTEALNIVNELLQMLIDGQPVYAQIIEQRIYRVNAQLLPFQLLKQLNSVAACIMLKFLLACCKLERLKYEWSAERDFHQGISINQQILNQFRHSTDPNICALSTMIYQQLFPNDYSMVDAFTSQFG